MQPSPFKVCPRCGVGNHPQALTCQRCALPFVAPVPFGYVPPLPFQWRPYVRVASILLVGFVLGWFGREQWFKHEIVSAFEGARGEAADRRHEDEVKEIAKRHEARMEQDDERRIMQMGGSPLDNSNRYRCFSPDDGRTYTEERYTPEGRLIDSTPGVSP